MPALGTIRAQKAKRVQARGIKPSYLEWYRGTIPPAYHLPPHIQFICEHVVQPIIDGDLNRVILTVPPQHGKSDTVTRRLPVYIGEIFPGDNVLLTGYGQDFANTELSQPARDLARDRGILSKYVRSLKTWKFRSGGKVSVRGVGSPPTGIPRLRWIIIDDPLKSRKDAESETLREAVWQWWSGTIVQRFWPETRVILIMTRWHEDDLVGRLLKKNPDEWTVINLPAIAIENDPMGREPGEALWPKEKPLPFLLQIKKESGPVEFEALFQGNPTPREGSFFHPNKILPCQVIPAGLTDCLAWDMAASEGTGDWTAAVQMWGPDAEGLFYVDVVRFQHEPSKRNTRIRLEADTRRPRKVRGPEDPGAAGIEAGQAFIKLLRGHAVHVEKVSGDKQLRAEPFAAQVNAGNVRLLDSEYTAAYREELRQFPNGKHDDMVDASSDAFSDLNQPESNHEKAIAALKAMTEKNKPQAQTQPA